MDKLSQIKAPIEKELKEQISLISEVLRSQIPLVDSVVSYFLEKKGKMVRPIMVLLASKLAGNGEVTANSLHSAVAVELLHNASLMHDDVIDEADTRRGRGTVNYVWDNKVAVLIGDFFLSKALNQVNLTKNLDIQAELTQLSCDLSIGELEQLANARGNVLSEDAYFSVIKNKTASLFRTCMKLGALSVNASPETIASLSLFGEKLGLVFQIRDDIFDYFDDKTIGKPTGNDIREGKVTLPLLYALINGVGEDNERMKAIIEKPEISPEEIQLLVKYAKESGGIDYAHATMMRIAYEAKQILNVFPESPAKNSFIAMVDYFIERRF